MTTRDEAPKKVRILRPAMLEKLLANGPRRAWMKDPLGRWTVPVEIYGVLPKLGGTNGKHSLEYRGVGWGCMRGTDWPEEFALEVAA